MIPDSERDVLQAFIFNDRSVRGQILRLNESYQTILQQHSYPGLLQQILGESLATATLLASTLKFSGRLIFQLQSEQGPLALVLAQCTHDFNLRALAQWEKEIDAVGLQQSLLNSQIAVTIQPDDNTDTYQSIINWHGEQLSETVEHYFSQSEQLSTFLRLAFDGSSVHGLLLQQVPDDNTARAQEDWSYAYQMAHTLKDKELSNLDAPTILHQLFHEDDITLFEPEPVKFFCDCTVPRMEQAILTLGEESAEEILADNKHIAVVCEFCNREYRFDRIDVTNLFKQNPGDQLH